MENQTTSISMANIRIIAGSLKGRRLACPNKCVRPTPNQARETLFNWLQQKIVNSRCLDVFAGSGALGIEALSRGAAWVSLWDSNPEHSQHYESTIQQWNLKSIEHQTVTFPQSPPFATTPYDIIFLDPPFDLYPLEQQVLWLLDNQLIKDTGVIYFERRALSEQATEILGWKTIRIRKQGAVEYGLLEKQGNRNE